MKTCTNCKETKELEQFFKSGLRNNLRSECKTCTKIRQYPQHKKWYSENRDKAINDYKNWRQKNPEKYEKVKEVGKKREKTAKYINLRKKYKEENKAKIYKWKKNYNNIYATNKRKTNVQFRLACNLRGRLTSALKGNQKTGSAVRDLGCSIDDLKFWLEFWWDEGMNWSNYGNKKGQWSIDHIFPLSKVDLVDRNQLLKVCHYTNLQPMWQIDNYYKGNKTAVEQSSLLEECL